MFIFRYMTERSDSDAVEYPILEYDIGQVVSEEIIMQNLLVFKKL